MFQSPGFSFWQVSSDSYCMGAAEGQRAFDRCNACPVCVFHRPGRNTLDQQVTASSIFCASYVSSQISSPLSRSFAAGSLRLNQPWRLGQRDRRWQRSLQRQQNAGRISWEESAELYNKFEEDDAENQASPPSLQVKSPVALQKIVPKPTDRNATKSLPRPDSL